MPAVGAPKSHVDCLPPLDNLCSACSQFNLSVEKFLPGQPKISSLPGFLARPIDPVGLQPRELGYLDEIYRRRDECPLCWLLFNATHATNEEGSDRFEWSRPNVRQAIGYDGLTRDGGRVRCSVEWQLDGRLLEPPVGTRDNTHAPPTRRLKVFSPDEIFTEAYIMLLPPDSHSTWDKTFLARRIAPHQADVSLLRRWLDICRTHHGSGCQPSPPDEIFSLLENLKFIDLDEEKIVTSARGGVQVTEYATLSYVWGGTQPLVLTKENVFKYSSRGSLGPNTPGLPNTVRDAMMLVKALGIKYIWVDALCIPQDDEEEKFRVVPMMDRVYGHSILTICAAASSGSHHGIPGSPSTPREARQPMVQCNGIDLVTTKTVEGLVENTMWNSRAWTFQERMLSKRSMIFVENRVFFQCRHATWSEEVFSEVLAPSWTLEMIRSPLKSFEKNPVRLYLECVELFSGRLMTYQGDRLPAFEGMAAILSPPLHATLFYGMPDSYFDFALLWEKKISGLRLEDLGGRSRYPSWSWSGWHGASTWRLSMVSGILLNLHEWLKSHTWVVWYKIARDDPTGNRTTVTGDASTKPIFEVVWSSDELCHNSNRWHGYARASAEDIPFGRQISQSDEEHPEEIAREPRPTMPTTTLLREDYLYFWTYTAFFQLSRTSRSSPSFASKLEAGLHRFGLLDLNGDWCGTVILEDTWFARVGDVVELAAISDARDFSMEELDSWNYYVPEDREVSEWHLYYAFVITWNKDCSVAERAGLAKVYQRAFDVASFHPGKAWKEITLG
ncbi:hypothetical protein CFIO01_02482 [Colletotrichum fioriniae PJ7]|uniref:Heterokaryon incompatibility domain-containing protein n=1 Tax=Colletotrichum fioriniae PJ7 TaxID=1445577 RepID=A0A010Q1K5_9PEZI|nr:hypothetical protein CFIO01_02482 [Colletotrichum fioriniae PJ7]